MRIIGIDYSLVSPALCLYTEDSISFKFFAQKKSQIGSFHNDLFEGTEPEKLEGMERYRRNSDFVLDHCYIFQPDLIAIEDYSYGSVSSSMLSLAENGGILRYRLNENGLRYIAYSPTKIKKVATGKGNAKKEQMYEFWMKEKNIDIASILKAKCDANPVSDIVDSWFVVKTALSDPNL